MRPSHKFGFWSSGQKNGLPGEGRHEGSGTEKRRSHKWFHRIFPCTNPCTDTFCTLSPPPTPQKPRMRCEPEEGYLRCSKQFDHRSHSIIFLVFEFKSVDDVGAGKLREMLTLHTNPHAVHGRFTPKDDCERQVWRPGPLHELKERIIDRCSTWAINLRNLWAKYFTSWQHYGWRLDCKLS